MKPWTLKIASLAAMALAIVVPSAATSRKAPLRDKNGQHAAAQTRIVENYGRLPLSFEENQEQAARDVKFVARGTAQTLSLSAQGATLNLRKCATHANQRNSDASSNLVSTDVRMTFAGSNQTPSIKGHEKLPGVANYAIGLDRSKWISDIPTYARVRFADVYPNIDLDYHGNNRQLEYDFVVRSGANPQNIRLAFDGVQGLELDAEGNLLIHAQGGDLLQHKPVAYQEIGGLRQEVPARFVLAGKNEVTFELGAYDRSRELVIDPVLAYSTYFGSANEDVINGIAVDAQGNAYIVGTSNSGGGNNFIFVNKINATGTASIYSTGVGDPNCNSYGNGIAVDANGLAYIAGQYGTWDQWQLCNPKYAITTKLNATGGFAYNLAWGGGDDHANAVAVDAQGNAYFTGETQGNWPVTANAIRSEGGFPGDAFVLKLDPAGSALYSSYLGGSGTDEGLGIAVDSQKNIAVVGYLGFASTDFLVTPGAFQSTPGNSWSPCFVTELNAAGTALRYSTYFSGEVGEQCSAVAVDSTGKLYVTGNTESSQFPTTPNAYDKLCGTDGFCNQIFRCDPTCHTTYFEDAFIAKFDPALTGAASLVYSTFIGGENRELGQGIAVDANGNAWVGGRTVSTFYPTVNPLQANNGGDYDIFVAEVSPNGSNLLFSTYLGGNGYDEARAMAVDAVGNIYLAGQTTSTAGFPTQNPLQGTIAGGTDGFLLKIGTAAGAPALNSLSLNPTVLNGPGTSTGTVTLTAAAPAGGIVVTLSSSNTNAATVPANVTVTQGNTSAAFTVTGKTVAAATTVTISGTYNGVTKSATLTVNPPGVTVTGLTLNPTTVTGGSPSTGTVTLSAAAPAGGITVALSSNNAAATVPANVVVAQGNTSATFTVNTTAVANVATATITGSYNGSSAQATLTINPPAPGLSSLSLNPTSVIGGATSTGTVTLTSAAPAGGITVTLSSNNAAATVPANVVVPQNATSATFTVNTSAVVNAVTATITATYNGVSKQATLTINPPALSALSVNPTVVLGGSNSTGTVTLTGVAPAGGITVTLSSNKAAASVPANVLVAAGNSTANFTITTTTVTADTTVTISASFSGVTKTATLTVQAPASVSVSSLAMLPVSVVSGKKSVGTVTLSGPAPANLSVTLTSSNPGAASVPGSVTVAAGATTATFNATTFGVAANTAVTISASYGGSTKTAKLTVKPAALASVTLSPKTVKGGNASTGTVKLNGLAPANGATVKLSSSNAAIANVPASVKVNGGASTATFTIGTNAVAANTTVTITATYNGKVKSAVLTVTP